MKFCFFVFSLMVTSIISRAQTNVFPSSGNVGIGTTSPGNGLTIEKDMGGGALAYFNSKNTTYGYGIAINTEANNAASYAIHAFRGGNQSNSLMWLGTNGNLGLGSSTPAAKISFGDLITNSVNGIAWSDGGPTSYGIHRTAGAWTAPDYQQLRVGWTTGVIIDPGSSYAKSFVDIQGNGLRVSSGSVGIGTTNTQGYKLAVAGTAIAESMTVKLQGAWPDYVFADSHKLPSLAETENFISTNKHLPGIPKAQEVADAGINLGDMSAKLLQKIEELTLHLIEQDKKNEQQAQEIRQLQASNNYLLGEINKKHRK